MELADTIDISSATVLVALGVVGFIVKTIGYTLVQTGRLDGNSLRYTFCNIVAAALVLVSMFDQFNLSAMLSQLMWISVGGVGVFRQTRRAGRRCDTRAPVADLHKRPTRTVAA